MLAALLNDGRHPKSGAQILKKETVDMMFENQIPEFPDFARQEIKAAKPEWTNQLPELYPQEGNPPQGKRACYRSLKEIVLTKDRLGIVVPFAHDAWPDWERGEQCQLGRHCELVLLD